MNFLKRAVKYCLRQRVRSLLLLLTFTLLSTTGLIAISSKKAVQHGTKQMKESVGASVRIEIDTNDRSNYGPAEDYGNGSSGFTYNGDFITQKIVDKISKFSNVIGYNAKSSEGFWGIPQNFEPLPAMVNAPGLATPYQSLLDSSLDVKFLNGTYKLEDGRHIKPDDTYAALISKELADKNDLSVGDKITFQNSVDEDRTSTFTITGIFSGTEGMAHSAITPDGIPANLGYINVNSLKDIYDLQGYDYMDVYTHTPEEASKLSEAIKNLPEVKGKTFVFNVNTEDFEMVSAPLSSFGSMVDATVWVITVIGISVIVLLLVLWTRGRKKEIGVLLAIGRSKAEIAGQLMAENIIIALLSVCTSTALTMILADRIGTYIIGRAGENATDLTVSAAASDMAATYGIGLAAVCLAVIIASYTVLRLKPKDILTKMD